MISYLRKNKRLVLFSLFFFLIQLPFLDQLSLLRGERDIMLSGYSLAQTGRDLYGHLISLEFLGIDPFVPFVPMYVAALWWLIIPVKTIFLARLLFVLISLSLPFLINEIVKHITRNEKLSFWTAIIFCFSPGIFHLTRLTLEIGIAFPLLLGGILAILKKRRLFSYFLFFLSFFSYHGFRPLIPVVLIYLELFEYLNNKKFFKIIKNSFFHVLFFLLLVGLSFFIDGNLMRSRINDVAFSGFEKWSNKIIYNRNTSIAPKKIAAVFDNKPIAMLLYMRDVFVKGQDLRYLFLTGDDSSLYATTFTGQFFLTLLLFYLLGFLFLGRKMKQEYFFMTGFIVVGLTPSLVNISYVSYSIRSILSSVGYAFIIACGIIYFLEIRQKLKPFMKKLLFSVILISISVELIFFIYNYYGRRFITMSEMFFESERQVAQYMIKNPHPYKIYTDAPRDVLFSYLFFHNNLNMKNVQNIVKAGAPYKINGFEIIKCPTNPKFAKQKEIIMDTCLTEKQYFQYSADGKYDEIIPYTNYSFRTAYFIFH